MGRSLLFCEFALSTIFVLGGSEKWLASEVSCLELGPKREMGRLVLPQVLGSAFSSGPTCLLVPAGLSGPHHSADRGKNWLWGLQATAHLWTSLPLMVLRWEVPLCSVLQVPGHFLSTSPAAVLAPSG